MSKETTEVNNAAIKSMIMDVVDRTLSNHEKLANEAGYSIDPHQLDKRTIESGVNQLLSNFNTSLNKETYMSRNILQKAIYGVGVPFGMTNRFIGRTIESIPYAGKHLVAGSCYGSAVTDLTIDTMQKFTDNVLETLGEKLGIAEEPKEVAKQVNTVVPPLAEVSAQ